MVGCVAPVDGGVRPVAGSRERYGVIGKRAARRLGDLGGHRRGVQDDAQLGRQPVQVALVTVGRDVVVRPDQVVARATAENVLGCVAAPRCIIFTSGHRAVIRPTSVSQSVSFRGAWTATVQPDESAGGSGMVSGAARFGGLAGAETPHRLQDRREADSGGHRRTSWKAAECHVPGHTPGAGRPSPARSIGIPQLSVDHRSEFPA